MRGTEILVEAKKKSKSDDSLAGVVSKIAVFGKTQGNVAKAYRARLEHAAPDAPDSQRERIARLRGLMAQIDGLLAQAQTESESFQM